MLSKRGLRAQVEWDEPSHRAGLGDGQSFISSTLADGE